MNSKCETLPQQPEAHTPRDYNLYFKWPIVQASNALKLWLGSYGEINRGPKLCTEYISHQSNFKINSTFDKQPIQLPCDLSDMLRLPLWVRFWQHSFYACWNPWRTPPPHSQPRENHHKALQWCLCEITNTWVALDCESIDKNSSDWAKEPKTQELIVQPHQHSYQAKRIISLESRSNWKQASSKNGCFDVV